MLRSVLCVVLIVSCVALVIVLLLPERAMRMYSHSGADKIQVQEPVIHSVFKSIGHCFIKMKLFLHH